MPYCAIVQQVPHPMPGLFPEFGDRNGCGGQGRCHVTSKRDVIEARHRDMPRHSDATFAQRTHQTHRDQIVEGQDTGCRRGQNALRGLVASAKLTP